MRADIQHIVIDKPLKPVLQRQPVKKGDGVIRPDFGLDIDIINVTKHQIDAVTGGKILQNDRQRRLFSGIGISAFTPV